MILDKAIAVAVTVLIAPAQGRFDIRPDRLDGLPVTRALVVLARQHDEERCCVDGAVVAPERHLTESRHLAQAALVQDLAGLSIGGRIDVGSLHRSQVAQHALWQWTGLPTGASSR